MSAYDCSCMLESALRVTDCLFSSSERKGEFTQKELSTLRHVTAVQDSSRTGPTGTWLKFTCENRVAKRRTELGSWGLPGTVWDRLGQAAFTRKVGTAE